MRRALLLLAIFATPLLAADKDERLFELRVYWAEDGKLDALHARFKDQLLPLLAKHGIDTLGAWTPVDNPEDRVYLLFATKDRESGNAAWRALSSDPDYRKMADALKGDGKTSKKVDRVYGTAADFSPAIKESDSKKDRVFELRTYLATPEKLPDLQGRFRDHTLKLFEKHGMTNLAYWTLADFERITCDKLLALATAKGDEKSDATGSDAAKSSALVYLLAHESADAAKKSWDAFRKDPDWVKAKEDSEKNGSLTVKNGVKSLMLKPAEYSKWK